MLPNEFAQPQPTLKKPGERGYCHWFCCHRFCPLSPVLYFANESRPKHETVHFNDPNKPQQWARAMNVIEVFGRQPFQFVIGAKLGNVPNVFLNVDFGVADKTLRVSGEAADIPDRTEAFYLSASLIPDQHTSPTYDSSTWGAIDILSCVHPSLGSLLRQPREVSFYRDSKDEARGLERIGCLESAVAIEFGGASAERSRIVLFATADYPCSVEMLTDQARCDELLAGLVRFVPEESD